MLTEEECKPGGASRVLVDGKQARETERKIVFIKLIHFSVQSVTRMAFL